MPSKRDVPGLVSRTELLAAVDRVERSVADRRVKHHLVELAAHADEAEGAGCFSSEILLSHPLRLPRPTIQQRLATGKLIEGVA